MTTRRLEGMLTTAQIGKRLNRSSMRVTRYIVEEQLPAAKIGGVYLIHEDDLRAWLARPEIAVMIAAGDQFRPNVRSARHQKAEARTV